VILDTNALSAFFDGDAKLGAKLGHAARLHLPVIVLGEYRFGVLRSKKRRLIEPALDALQASTTVLSIEAGTVVLYAKVRDFLRSAGTPIPSNDVWIAALAMQHSLPVVSRDAHFDHVRGLTRIAW
jgi:tRNA(fMet)-specific endonuclease VapC